MDVTATGTTHHQESWEWVPSIEIHTISSESDWPEVGDLPDDELTVSVDPPEPGPEAEAPPQGTQTQCLPWTPVGSSTLIGFVESLDEVQAVIKTFEVASSLTYVKDYERCLLGGLEGGASSGRTTRTTDKEEDDEGRSATAAAGIGSVKQRSIRFQDPGGNLIPDEGVPFVLKRRILYTCMFGRDKSASRKKKEKERRAELLSGDHPAKRRYKKITGSRKKGCTASIHIKEVTRFTKYKDCNTMWKKRKASEQIHLALLKGEPLSSETRFYISLPSQEDHEKTHSVGEFTGFLNPLSRELRDRIQELVAHGVTSVKEMKRHLKIYVETSLFPNPEKRPASTNVAYYPTEKCLRNHIYASIVKLRMPCH